MAETEMGYGDWRKHTSGVLSDTFQTTGRQLLVGKVIFAQTTSGLCVIIPILLERDWYSWMVFLRPQNRVSAILHASNADINLGNLH